MAQNQGTGVIYRPYVAALPIQGGSTHDFDVPVGTQRILHYHSGYVFIVVVSEHSLYVEQVRAALNGLDDAQIVHISVTVEVKVAYAKGIVVKEHFELPYRRTLRKHCAHGTQIKGPVVIIDGAVCHETSAACQQQCGKCRNTQSVFHMLNVN